MSEPKITVIIPTRERCDVLGKTLETVLAQDYERVQVIVSDNPSVVDDHNAGTHVLHDVHVVTRHNHRPTLCLGKVTENLPQLVGRFDIEAKRWFVEQYDRRCLYQRAGDGQAPVDDRALETLKDIPREEVLQALAVALGKGGDDPAIGLARAGQELRCVEAAVGKLDVQQSGGGWRDILRR